MSNQINRPVLAGGVHPIETARYLLATPAIASLYSEVCRWVDNRAPGGMIYGQPRLGKTRAIQYLEQALPERFEQLPIIVLPSREYRLASEGSFFEDLLRAAGHAIVTQGRISQKRDRLQEFLIEKVEMTGQNRLLLFIDEAQKLHEYHYKWLMDLHNELDRSRVDLIVLLVGQEDLLYQYSAFKLTKKKQIIGRFMAHQTAFRGIRSVEDVSACLNMYDENSEYPEGSNWSFTRYFYPAAFLTGWRLKDYAGGLWSAFLEIKREQHLPKSTDLPMQYFCRTVEYILRHHGSYSEDPGSISLNLWKEALENSGYVDIRRYIVVED